MSKSSSSWRPKLGAIYNRETNTTQFSVWSPSAQSISLILTNEKGEQIEKEVQLEKGHTNIWKKSLKIQPDTLYKYKINGKGPFPDVVSRFQPFGVHGPSMVVDNQQYHWKNPGFVLRKLSDCIIYELHVGTFTPEGTFQSAIGKLEYLVALGVNTIEIMPLADFPGNRNWGYDGVCFYAPPRCYGKPDDLKALIDVAHGFGLTVILDVVYNHFGPDGNYTGVYTSSYLSKEHSTPWGTALNLDGENSDGVRLFLIENSLYWLHDFHIDGFRFDATHALVDDCIHPSPHPHFLEDLINNIRGVNKGIIVTGEDERNLALMIGKRKAGRIDTDGELEGEGWGFNGIWSDDFHHQVRVMLVGDYESYYRYFSGSLDDLTTTINQGWFYVGQSQTVCNKTTLKLELESKLKSELESKLELDPKLESKLELEPKSELEDSHKPIKRGSDPKGIPHCSFVVCIQNHDQVGNRPLGDRLHHKIPLFSYLTASSLLLLIPQTPLLFQGQEFASSSPFLFFTDHNDHLGKLVTEGRRKEFKHFSDFENKSTDSIPDPQSEKTFKMSCLKWDEIQSGIHKYTLEVYKRLLSIRKSLQNVSLAVSHDKFPRYEDMSIAPIKDTAVLSLLRKTKEGGTVLCFFNFSELPISLVFKPSPSEKEQVNQVIVQDLPPRIKEALHSIKKWDVLLDTNNVIGENIVLDTEVKPTTVLFDNGLAQVKFDKYGAIVLQGI